MSDPGSITGSSTRELRTNDIYQLSNRTQAVGTLRKGKFAGRRVIITGGPYREPHIGDGIFHTWFESACKMYDSKTGEFLGASDCGVLRGHSLAYGYYVFVVAGTDGKKGLFSHTEDGINWHVQVKGPGEIRALVVGPRPTHYKDETRPHEYDPDFDPPLPPVIIGPPPRPGVIVPPIEVAGSTGPEGA